MKRHLLPVSLTLLILLLGMAPAMAQNAARQFQGYAVNGNVLEVRTSDGVVRIRPYSDQIVETSFIPQGEQFNPDSVAVVMTPATVRPTVKETTDRLELKTAGISVTIKKSPFQISYFYHGRLLTSENAGYVKDERGETLSFNLDPDEALYGTGARALGMNRRGNRVPLYNKAHYGYEQHSEQMNFSLALIYSSNLYGIHFDNAPIGYLDLDSRHDNVLTYETIGGRKTYQVLGADSWPELMADYTALTGHQPLPPRWALGNFASRFGYHSDSEARGVVAQFAAQQIPLDAIIFDLYWFGKEMKGTMGNLEFDPDSFPDPKKMIADFSDQGVKTILITEPFILTSSSKWKEAVQNNILATNAGGQPYVYDFYFGQTGLIDIFKPQAQDWFWNIYKKYTQWGVAGWWGDLGEPEVHPHDLQHVNGSADQVHNIYGHTWAKLIADGYRRDFPEQRPFILMRSGYAGSQRTGMIPWSGDVNRTWGGLQSQPEIALQMGMQGMAYMHSDLGGFAGANLDNELYARWLQYGVFQPVFRPHAQEEVASEPVLREPATRALAKAAIELRYQMLPYNYTLAFDNAQNGMPLMRALFFAEPHNRSLYTTADSYLWGDAFLVRPVLQAGVKELPVYFPAHSGWFDFYTGQRYEGGTTRSIAVVPDHIPVFVRAGAFVPLIDVIQNTEKYSTRTINLHYYHDRTVTKGRGRLYDDDGKTPDAFLKGEYTLLNFASQFSAGQLSIAISPDNGKNAPGIERRINLFIHHVEAKPQQVQLQSGATRLVVPFRWNSSTQILDVTVPVAQAAALKLTVTLADHKEKKN
jgi:alpha-glucosidase (family GH31 glycosyl hydrolase)